MNYIPGGYLISANISSATGIQSVTLCWSADTTLGFDEIAMEYVNNNYEAYIPSSNVDGDLFYYIKAVNNNNKTINKPLVAPADFTDSTLMVVEKIIILISVHRL